MPGCRSPPTKSCPAGEFEVAELPRGAPRLRIHHDEDAEVRLNGTLVARLPGFTTGYTLHLVTEEIRKALRTGENVLAVHCRQTAGGQFIDVGVRTAR